MSQESEEIKYVAKEEFDELKDEFEYLRDEYLPCLQLESSRNLELSINYARMQETVEGLFHNMTLMNRKIDRLNDAYQNMVPKAVC